MSSLITKLPVKNTFIYVWGQKCACMSSVMRRVENDEAMETEAMDGRVCLRLNLAMCLC